MSLQTISEESVEQRVQPEDLCGCEATENGLAGIAARECSWLLFVREQLRAIAALSAGWDSHGAPSPDSRLVVAAWHLIASLAQVADLPQPYVNPTRSGGVQFEWEAGDRYFEIEVTGEQEATYYWADHSNADQEQGTVLGGDPLDTVLECIRRVGA